MIQRDIVMQVKNYFIILEEMEMGRRRENCMPYQHTPMQVQLQTAVVCQDLNNLNPFIIELTNGFA